MHDIKNSYKGILSNISWMDEETRRRALQKLDSMIEYIAYPDFLLTDIPRLDKYYEKVTFSCCYLHTAYLTWDAGAC